MQIFLSTIRPHLIDCSQRIDMIDSRYCAKFAIASGYVRKFRTRVSIEARTKEQLRASSCIQSLCVSPGSGTARLGDEHPVDVTCCSSGGTVKNHI